MLYAIRSAITARAELFVVLNGRHESYV